MPSEIILAESITLPPPRATITSTLFCFPIIVAFSTSSIIGFGLIPEYSKISRPDS